MGVTALSIYSRLYDFLAGATVRSQEFDDEFNAIQSGFSAVETRLQAAIHTPENTTQTLPVAATRANKLLAFDGSGNAVATASLTGAFSFSGTVSCANPVAANHAATKAWVETLALSAAIPVTGGDAGKYLTNNGSTLQWGVGIPSLTGNAGKVLLANATETGLVFGATAEVPINSAVILAAENTANTVTLQGATYLKTGVISNKTTYPLAQLKSYTFATLLTSAPAAIIQAGTGVSALGSIVTDPNANVIYTYNGSSWSSPQLPINAQGRPLFSGTRVLCAGSGVDTCCYSDNLTDWNQAPLPASSSNYWRSQCYNNGKFVLCRGGAANALLAYSSDGGVSWNTSNSLPSAQIWSIRAIGSLFLAFSSTSTTNYYTSTDLLTWTLRTALPVAQNWSNFLQYVNGRLFAGAFSGSVYYTTDGLTWTLLPLPFSFSGAFGIEYVNDRYVVGGGGAYSLYTSTDLVTWHQGWRAATNTPQMWVLGGACYTGSFANFSKIEVDASGYVGNPTNKTIDVGDGQLEIGVPINCNYYIRVN